MWFIRQDECHEEKKNRQPKGDSVRDHMVVRVGLK